jgi:hypothetical protein
MYDDFLSGVAIVARRGGKGLPRLRIGRTRAHPLSLFFVAGYSLSNSGSPWRIARSGSFRVQPA